MPNLALYTHAEITRYSHEVLADGRPIALIHQLAGDNWGFTLGKLTQQGFSSYLLAYRQACWLHKYLTKQARTLLAA
jgi:hypothetical protein